MNAAAVRDGGVLSQGDRIVGLGAGSTLRHDHPGATVHDYGAAVILPGLVNAHTHLELSHLSPPQRVRSFPDWLLTVMAPGPGGDDALRRGVQECLRFGVTCVGDISRDPPAARRVLADSPLTAVSYGEV